MLLSSNNFSVACVAESALARAYYTVLYCTVYVQCTMRTARAKPSTAPAPSHLRGARVSAAHARPFGAARPVDCPASRAPLRRLAASLHADWRPQTPTSLARPPNDRRCCRFWRCCRWRSRQCCLAFGACLSAARWRSPAARDADDVYVAARESPGGRKLASAADGRRPLHLERQ